MSFPMLKWSMIFLVIALIAALFGFGIVASTAASIAKVLFFLFLAFFIITLIAGSFFVKKVKGTAKNFFDRV